jgi:hypothetical protein
MGLGSEWMTTGGAARNSSKLNRALFCCGAVL